MSDAAKQFYDSINQYSDLQSLIDNGEPEGLHLECKAPTAPQLTREMKNNFARAISGFSNTAGGVILWGVSTTKHEHSGLDILTQIEPIGNCRLFARHIEKAIPTLTTPLVSTIESKIITINKTDTRGVIVTYIPKGLGDPVQSSIDNIFYFRSGDDFSVAPYEMVKRLFASTEIPDLHLVFNSQLVKIIEGGLWEIPIIIENASSAIADHIKVSVKIENPSVCEDIQTTSFVDTSSFNPGSRIFMANVHDIVHRGLNNYIGSIRVKMKVEKRPKRLLKMTIAIYANKMRARLISATIQLAKKGFSVLALKENYLY